MVLSRSRLEIIAIISALIIYSLVALSFVVTSPDLRVRCLLTSNQQKPEAITHGIEVRDVLLQSSADIGPIEEYFGEAPKVGDWIVSIAGKPVDSFTRYSQAIAALRTPWYAETTYDEYLPAGSDPLELEYKGLPSIVTVETDAQSTSRLAIRNPGTKYVRTQFYREGWQSPRTVWLQIHSLPVVDLMLTILWFLLEAVVVGFAAFTAWHRPEDRVARRFLWVSAVTVVAFIGGFHWWILSASYSLITPFTLCALLLAPLTFHFFMTYPNPGDWYMKNRKWVLPLVYSPFVLMMFAMGGLITTLYSTVNVGNSPELVNQLLEMIRLSAYCGISLAGLYFVGGSFVLWGMARTTANEIDHLQLRWLLLAACLSYVPLAYTMWLAFVDQPGFVLGKAKLPMILVSLFFLAAYAVGILRYRLMLLDRPLMRTLLYWVVSQFINLMFASTITLSVLGVLYLGLVVQDQMVPALVVLVISVVLLVWFRDQVKETIDQQFFREKYQLDRTLQKLNIAVRDPASPESLAEQMLDACREVLGVKHAGLYLMTETSGQFQLASGSTSPVLPVNITLTERVMDYIRRTGTVQRSVSGVRTVPSFVYDELRLTHSHLIQAFIQEETFHGFILLGAKSRGGGFSAEDITFLKTILQITAVALNTSRLQQDAKRVNATLNEKVNKLEEQQRQLALLKEQLEQSRQSQNALIVNEEVDSLKRSEIKGKSGAIEKVLATVQKVSNSDASVLIRGESGTGKELVARAIHDNSSRSSKPLVSVHCAALSSGLLESELFGHVKGAFTGAHQNKTGRFEAAQGGTLFLDEIGDISMETQVKLLRALQERRIEPVGGSKSIEIDVRLLAATHQNLEKLIEEGKFREDLYYRLNVITIQTPALRDRKEDLPELVAHFLNQSNAKSGRQVNGISNQAMETILGYLWPGNIRQLRNAIEHAVVLAESETIEWHNLPNELQTHQPDMERVEVVSALPALSATEQVRSQKESFALSEPKPVATTRYEETLADWQQYQAVMAQAGGNKARAARLLGLPRSTFYSRWKRLNDQYGS